MSKCSISGPLHYFKWQKILLLWLCFWHLLKIFLQNHNIGPEVPHGNYWLTLSGWVGATSLNKETRLQWLSSPTFSTTVPLTQLNNLCHLQVCPTWSTLVWDHLVQTKIKLLKKKKTVIVNQKVLTVRNVVAKDKLTASKTNYRFLILHTCLLDSLEPLPREGEQKLYCLRYHFYSCQQRIRLHSDEG